MNEAETIKLVVDRTSPEGATYSIINNSDKTIVYSYYYHLDVEQNGVWYRIKDNNGMLVLSVRLGTSPGTLNTYECEWKERYGSLPEGHYRLVKGYSFNGEFKRHYLTAEFTVD